MIKHGVKQGEIKCDDDEVNEFIEIENMPESIEKHKMLVLLNPDNYRSWKYIRDSIGKNVTEKDIDVQMRLTLNAIKRNPKSYSAWSHREFFFRYAEEYTSHEIILCRMLLSVDSRNFHCWNYCRKFGLQMPIDYGNFSSIYAKFMIQNRMLDNKTNRHGMACKKNYSGCDNSYFAKSIENLMTDPDDEGAWAYFRYKEVENTVGTIHIYPTHTELIFKKPLTTSFSYGGVEYSVDRPYLCYCIENPTVFKFDNTLNNAENISNILNNTANNSNVEGNHLSQQINDKNIATRDNAIEYFSKVTYGNYDIIIDGIPCVIEEKKEPEIINNILELNPNCIFALREKLIYTREPVQRSHIIAQLIKNDKIRAGYYTNLITKKYISYNIISK